MTDTQKHKVYTSFEDLEDPDYKDPEDELDPDDEDYFLKLHVKDCSGCPGCVYARHKDSIQRYLEEINDE